MGPPRVTVEVDPEEVRRGEELRVAVRVDRRVPALYMRIIDVGSGLVVFRTMRMTRGPWTRGQDFNVGTRFMAGGRTYLITVAPGRNLRGAAHARFDVVRRSGPVPLALVLPVLMGWMWGDATVEPDAPPGRPVRERPSGEGAGEPDTRVRDEPGDAWDPAEPREIRGVRVQDPWGTGSPYTRGQVEAVLEREREKRRKNPDMRPLPEGSVEEVMAELARDRARQLKKLARYDLNRPVKHYVFLTEQDSRVCVRCALLHGRTWRPWQWRPAIPLHPNCRCRYERIWSLPPRRQRRPGPDAAIRVIRGVRARRGHGKP